MPVVSSAQCADAERARSTAACVRKMCLDAASSSSSRSSTRRSSVRHAVSLRMGNICSTGMTERPCDGTLPDVRGTYSAMFIAPMNIGAAHPTAWALYTFSVT